MSRPVRAGVASACLIAVTVVAPSFAASTRDATRVVTAGWSAPPAAATSLGAARLRQPVVVDVVLEARDEATLDRLAARALRPANATTELLTPAGYAQRFAPSARVVSQLSQWAAHTHVTTTYVSGSRSIVQLSGTQRDIERLFKVRLAEFRSGHTVWWQADRPPSVPAALPASAVIGLDDRWRATVPSPATRAHRSSGDPTSLAPGSTGPHDLWDVYDQPSANRGSGERLAVIGEGSTQGLAAALRYFQLANRLPAMPMHVHHVGAGPFTDQSGFGEWMLDTQAASGMAPDAASLELYFARDTQITSLLVAFDKWVNDPTGPRQASASFGWCEATPVLADRGYTIPPAIDEATDKVLRQAVLEGRTLFAAAGDNGSSCPLIGPSVNGATNDGVPIAEYPAASPYAVAVGGTVLYPERTIGHAYRGAEVAWTHTGGGSSLFVSRPSYQSGISTMLFDCVATPDGSAYPTPTPCRGVPDVAALSGDLATSSYTIYDPGDTQLSASGTSLSAPLWQGMWARIQAASPLGRGGRVAGLGFADPRLYAVAARTPAAFYDVTAGGNGAYVATPGWDYVSGLGVPDVTALMRALDHRIAPTHPARAGAMPRTVAPGVAACSPLWARDGLMLGYYYLTAEGQDPQLELLQGDMHLVDNWQALRVSVDVADMNVVMPPGASTLVYLTTWVLQVHGQPVGGFFARADVDADGTTVYSDGIWNPYAGAGVAPYTTLHANLRGRIRLGPGGGVDVDVPLADIGHPHRGDVLFQPASQAYGLIGVPALDVGLRQQQAAGVLAEGSTSNDSDPHFDYTVGEVCAKTGRPGTSGG